MERKENYHYEIHLRGIRRGEGDSRHLSFADNGLTHGTSSKLRLCHSRIVVSRRPLSVAMTTEYPLPNITCAEGYTYLDYSRPSASCDGATLRETHPIFIPIRISLAPSSLPTSARTTRSLLNCLEVVYNIGRLTRLVRWDLHLILRSSFDGLTC